MPIVPQQPGFVQEIALPGIRANEAAAPEAFGSIGKGANPYEATSGIGQDIIRIAESEKRNADDVATTDAHTKLLNLKNSLLYDKDTGAYTKKESDAFNVVDEYGSQFDKSAQAIQDGLKGDEQKAIFGRMKTQYANELNSELNRHVFQEAQKFDTTTFKNGVEASRNDAVMNYQNPDKVQESLGTQRALLFSYAQRNGISPDSDQFKVLDSDIQSKTHSDVIDRMINNGQDVAAKDYFDQNKDAIVGSDLLKTEKMVEEGTSRGQSQRIVDDILNRNLPSSDALSEIRAVENPKVRDAAYERYKQEITTQKALEADNRQKQFQGISDIIEQSQGMAEIPVNQRVGLSISENKAIDDRIKQLRSGVEYPPNGQDYYNLKLLAATPQTRDDFLKTNVLDYGYKMTNSERHELIETQANLKKNDEKTDSLLSDFRTKDEVITGVLKRIGIRPDSKSKDVQDKIDQFRAMVAEQQRAYQQQTGKMATNADLEGFANQLAGKAVEEKGIYGFHWLLDKNVPFFEVPRGADFSVKIDEVPRSERIKIEDALTRSNVPITDSNIINLYSQKLKGLTNSGR